MGLSRQLLPQLLPPTLSLLPTMSATRSTTPSSTCPRSPSRWPSRPTQPTTSSTTPQLLEPSLDSSQLLPQLLLLPNLLRLPQLSRRLRSSVDKNISTTALKFMKLENIKLFSKSCLLGARLCQTTNIKSTKIK